MHQDAALVFGLLFGREHCHQLFLEGVDLSDDRLVGEISREALSLTVCQVAGVLLQEPHAAASTIEFGIDLAACLHQVIEREAHDMEAVGHHERLGKVGFCD